MRLESKVQESMARLDLPFLVGSEIVAPHLFFSPSVSPSAALRLESCPPSYTMTRGNQRDNDRAKALKKAASSVRP